LIVAGSEPAASTRIWAVIIARTPAATAARNGSSASAVTRPTTGSSRCESSAAYRLPVPEPPLSLLSPLLSVVPGQLFAWALARAKGLDSDSPRGLSKITLAR